MFKSKNKNKSSGRKQNNTKKNSNHKKKDRIILKMNLNFYYSIFSLTKKLILHIF
jgi:hypothetical protein